MLKKKFDKKERKKNMIIFSEEIKKQIFDFEDSNVYPVVKKLKSSYQCNSSLLLNYKECALLFDYFSNLNSYIRNLDDENEEMSNDMFKLYMFNRFLQLENKTLRDDKANTQR